jgi:hypothetical protein
MGEVPVIVEADALSIIVIAMITNWFHASGLASFADTFAVDCGVHLDTFESNRLAIRSPGKMDAIRVAGFGAQSLLVPVIVV